MSFKIDYVEGDGAFADMNSNEKLRSPGEGGNPPTYLKRLPQRDGAFFQERPDQADYPKLIAFLTEATANWRTQSPSVRPPISEIESWGSLPQSLGAGNSYGPGGKSSA